MFIIVQNPPTSPEQFGSVLQSVVPNIYAVSEEAQKDAINLSNANPGKVYSVFQLIIVGSAVSTVVPTPALWSQPTVLDVAENVPPPPTV